MKPKLEGKRWNREWEKPIYDGWKNSFKFRKNNKPVFSIDTPPPYVNTPIHIGHATTYVLMDMFARFKRMTGYNVVFPLGLDRNGLPIEVAAQKKFNISMHDTPREKFIACCKKVLEESSDISTEDLLRLGISFSSWDFGSKEIGAAYYTDSDDYRKLTQETFIDLWNKGLVYQDKRLNNYCPGCRTTIADSEIERKKTSTYLNYVKFKVIGDKDVTIATTRPELLCTSALIIYNPKDPRYKHLKGKRAIAPIFNIEVPIQEDREADMNFGTGLVFMSASAGDQDAVRFLRKRNIEPIQAVGEDGKMLPVAKMLKGLHTKKARAKIIEALKEKRLLEKQEQIEHTVPICERSKDVIEFVAMPEYYLKQVEFKEKIRELSKKIHFHSPKSRQMLFDWIDSVSMDWAISRRRYYATEIPLWYCKKCNKPFIPPKGRYYRPWKDRPPGKCKCGSPEFIPDTRVFDTWFDSSISPLYILKYTDDPKFFAESIPATLRPQGKEIIRTWLYYTLLRCYQLTSKSIFKDVWINYHVLDGKGIKMSKSLGNVIDPREILDKYGAEPFRLWATVEGNLTETDFRCSFERIGSAGKFLTKLWNISRFISMFPTVKKPKLTDTDKWILSELRELVEFSRKSYENYDFHAPVTRIKNFTWETFASHYMELVKTRAYNEGGFSQEEQDSAIYTLNRSLDVLLKLLSPVIPFLTYKIYKDLRGKDIHSEEFPEAEKKHNIPFKSEDLLNLNTLIWKFKQEKGMTLRAEIPHATIPQNLKSMEKDIKKTHNIKEIKYGKQIHLGKG